MEFINTILVFVDAFCLWFSLLSGPVLSVTLEPMFDSPIANVSVKEMTTAVLPCSVKYLGKHMVIWTDSYSTLLTFEERRIIDDDRLSVERPFIKDWNLHIRNVKYKDQGMYNCQINTNPVKIKVVHLTVKVPAKINNNSSTDSIKVREGDTVTLQCNVSGIPVPTVTWQRLIRNEKGEAKKSEFCTSTNKIGMSGDVLIIHNISRHCGDVYECSAFNGVPPAVSRFITVSVQFPPEISLPNGRMGQMLGKETILECQITANPQAGGIWRKDGEEMKTMSGKYRVEMYPEDTMTVTISLRIVFIEKSDFGVYTCEAYNQLGKDSGTMILHEYAPLRLPPATTTTTTTTLLPPPYDTAQTHQDHYSHRNENNRHQQLSRHHHQHSTHQFQHGTNQVVVKDDESNIRLESGFNNGYNGKTGESLTRENTAANLKTSPVLIHSLLLALITVAHNILY